MTKLGFIGLGRMGSNMVELLLEKGYREVFVTDKNPNATSFLVAGGARGTSSIPELVEKLESPRLVWLMVPRSAVQEVLDELTPLLTEGDTVIDGGNTFYKDTIKRSEELSSQGINYLDVGVSGGVDGARHGACMMVGGKQEVFEQYRQLFDDLTVPDGYGYMGVSGAGHFVKMVHNGIEYGMMGAISEGMEVLDTVKTDFNIDLAEVIRVYAHGSINAGRLMDWLGSGWKEDPGLESISGEVPYGETEEEMEKLEKIIGFPTLITAHKERVATRGTPSFTGKVINTLRYQFGGHLPKKKE